MSAAITFAPTALESRLKPESAQAPELLIPFSGIIREFGLDDYQKLINVGFFQPDEHVELIHGHLIRMSPSNPPHAGTLARLAAILTFRLWNRALVRTQSAI